MSKNFFIMAQVPHEINICLTNYCFIQPDKKSEAKVMIIFQCSELPVELKP
jgi:hypothetical protein